MSEWMNFGRMDEWANQSAPRSKERGPPHGEGVRPTTLDDVHPRQLYPAATCCKLIPSSRQGKTLNLKTWHDWRKQGRFEACKLGSRWFMRGCELMRLLRLDEPAPVLPRSKAELDRADREARAAMREMGVKFSDDPDDAPAAGGGARPKRRKKP